MKRKLWEKNSVSLDKSIEHFTVGTDYLLDQHLALFDLYGSAAHVRMLDKIGIISSGELDAILTALKKIKQEIQEGSR